MDTPARRNLDDKRAADSPEIEHAATSEQRQRQRLENIAIVLAVSLVIFATALVGLR